MAKNGKIDSFGSIKPKDLIKKGVNLYRDLHFSITKDCGRGGFEFCLHSGSGCGIDYQIAQRECRLFISGAFLVSGTFNIEKKLYCHITVAVNPTDESTKDGYAYHCHYVEKTNDYQYTQDVVDLVEALLDVMWSKWADEDYVYAKAYPCKRDESVYNGVAMLMTHKDLQWGDNLLHY